MTAILMKDGVYWVGVRDPELRIFDLVMTTDVGTSYNAYLIKGSSKTALIEVCESKFFDEYREKVQSLVDLGSIDYLIMNHTEPDHSEAVARLLELIPGITVMASQTALGFLKDITNKKFKSQEIKDGDRLDLGGKTLCFFSVPFLHWPDTIYTYLEEERILFSCDSFGTHWPDERLFNDLMENNFLTPYKEYFDVLSVLSNLTYGRLWTKIKDLPRTCGPRAWSHTAPGYRPLY
jgi:flavorubredoxin